MSNWLWTWLSCKRRFPQPEEPSLRKVRKLLGADTRVQANRGNEEVGYETLVSKREETNSALLGRKVRLLKTVLRRAELVSLTGTKELYKSLPLDLNPADDAEATSYSPHRALEPINSESASFRFGLSGLRIKDVSCIQEGRLLQELVGNSFIFATAKEMFAQRCFDIGKFKTCFRLASLVENRGKLVLPINWKDGHWSCAVIDFPGRQIHHFDAVTSTRTHEVFSTLTWLLSHWLNERHFTLSPSTHLPSLSPSHSGLFTMWILRCFALNSSLPSPELDIVKIRKILVLELKRSLIVS